MTRWLAALPFLMLTGCPFTAPTPLARVRRGPAHGEILTPITALPVVCQSEPGLCTQVHADAVASATRMALEFAGYNLLDSELINAEMRRRSTITQETSDGFTTSESTQTTMTGGASWAELPPPQQRDLLAALGVRGLLHATITMGPSRGLAQQRTITVAVTVTRLHDNGLAWHSRCGVETGDYHSTEQATDLATRCAIEAGALW